MRSSKILIVAAVAGLLAACSHQNPGFGDAVHQNLTAQIADPDAKYARDLPPASSGSRTSLAQTRYQKGQVLQPANTSTTTMQMGASGSGASAK